MFLALDVRLRGWYCPWRLRPECLPSLGAQSPCWVLETSCHVHDCDRAPDCGHDPKKTATVRLSTPLHSDAMCQFLKDLGAQQKQLL